MYFPLLSLHGWGERLGEGRRHNCAVMPLVKFQTGARHMGPSEGRVPTGREGSSAHLCAATSVCVHVGCPSFPTKNRAILGAEELQQYPLHRTSFSITGR